MENYDDLSPIELNVLINKTKEIHENIKKEIKDLLSQVDELSVDINNKIKLLESTEEKYVELISILVEKTKNV